MEDKLDLLFSYQEQLDSYIAKKRSMDAKKESKEEYQSLWVQKITLAIIDELSELLNEVNYKWWKNPKEMDRDKVCDEMVDILHFFISMCLVMDMDADELFHRYEMKNKENFARQDGKSRKTGYNIEEL